MEEETTIDAIVKAALEFIDSKRTYLKIAEDLFTIYNRKLTPFIEKRLDTDLKGQESRAEAKLRISSINVLPMVVDKLSHVYDADVNRVAKGMSPKEFEGMLDSWNMAEALDMANKMLNLHRCVAIEPVLEKKLLRVIPAHKFLVMGDGTIDNVMTGFIKIISTQRDLSGNTVEVYELITAEYFISFNSNGDIISREPNLFKVIPVVYATRDTVTLMPEEDSDTFNMVTLLPLLLTDGNFAIKFQCFSIIYTMNVEAKNMTMSPNAVWHLKSVGGDNDKPELGVIKPSVNIPDILEWIRAQFSLWLESKNLKLKALGGAGNALENASGIAKAIDAADVSSDLKYQRRIFSRVERDIFRTIGVLSDSAFDLSTSFKSENLIPESNKEKIETLVLKVTNGLMSKDQAIKEANNHMTSEEIALMIAQIDKEHEEDELRSRNENSIASKEKLAPRVPRESRPGSGQDDSREDGEGN
jgi:hypothetical protein